MERMDGVRRTGRLSGFIERSAVRSPSVFGVRLFGGNASGFFIRLSNRKK